MININYIHHFLTIMINHIFLNILKTEKKLFPYSFEANQLLPFKQFYLS